MSMMRPYSKGILWIFDFSLGPENGSVQNVPPCFMGKPGYRNQVSQKSSLFVVDLVHLVHLPSAQKGERRTLLVVTTGDLEQVTLELIAEGVADNLIEREKPNQPIRSSQLYLFV